MALPCNQIDTTFALLRSKFINCTRLEADDMQLLLNLIEAVELCAVSQDNLFLQKDLGTYDVGTAIETLANALTGYTVLQTQIVLFTGTETLLSGQTRSSRYVMLNKGEGTYGVGGIQLLNSDILSLTPNTSTKNLINEGEDGNNPYISFSDIYRDNILLSGNYNNIIGSYQYFVWADSYIINNTYFDTYISDTVTLEVADGTDDRIDLIVINENGTITVEKGTAAVNPTKPIIDPITQLEVGLIIVTANTTAPVGVTKIPIYNENLQVVGGEWDTLTINDALVDKVVDPSLGATHMHLLFSNTASRIELRNTSLIKVDSFDKIIFKMKKLDAVPSGPFPGGNVCFLFKNESLNNQGKQACFMNTGNSIFGFDESIIGTYQTVTIDSSFFGLGNFTITEFDLIQIVKGGNGEYYIDDIYFESGTPISGGPCDCVKKTSDIINDGEDGNNPYISNLDIYRDNILLSGNYENIIGTYQFFVWADNYIINNIEYSTYYSDTITLTAPSVTNGQDRFDVIVISNTGVISAVEGVTSATPEKPLIDDETQVEIGLVLVSGATTNPIGVTNTVLYDENLQVGGGEWNTFLQGDAIDSAIVEPSNGIIHGVLVTRGDIFAVSNPVEVNSGDIDKLRFKIKLISGEEQRFYIRFSKVGLRKQWRIPLYDGIYGFDENNLSTYQTIIIPNTDIGLASFDTIRFQSRDNGESYLDEIIFQNGTPTDPGTGIPSIIDTNTNIANETLTIPNGTFRDLIVEAGAALDILAGISTNLYIDENEISLAGNSQITLLGNGRSSITLANDLVLRQNNIANGIFIQPTISSISTIGQVLTAVDTFGEVEWADPINTAGFVTVTGNQNIGGVKTFTNNTNAIVLTGVTSSSTAASLFITHASTAGHAILINGLTGSGGNILEIRDNGVPSFTVVKEGAVAAEGLITSNQTVAQVEAGTGKTLATTDWVNSKKNLLERKDVSTLTYTLLISDVDKMIVNTNAVGGTVTIPLNATAPFPIGTNLIVFAGDPNGTTIDGAVGVDIRNSVGVNLLMNQWMKRVLTKIATDEWIVSD